MTADLAERQPEGPFGQSREVGCDGTTEPMRAGWSWLHATYPDSWAKRALHWNYAGAYARKVSDAMDTPGVRDSEACRATGAGWSAIHSHLTDALVSGTIPGIPKGRP